MCKRECCHCLCLQELHRATNLQRPKIAGMSLVVERPHNKYGSAILIRNDLKVMKIYERVQGTVVITIVMSGVVVHSVYKPPNDLFELPALAHRNLPHIVIGDFNSHSTMWGYTSTDNEGEAVEQWVDSCDFTLTPGRASLEKLGCRTPPQLHAGGVCRQQQEGTLTGTAFIDLSAAYDTVFFLSCHYTFPIHCLTHSFAGS